LKPMATTITFRFSHLPPPTSSILFQISDSSRLYAASSGTFTANGFSCDGFKRPQNGGIDEVGDSLLIRIAFQGCPFATIETYNPAYPGCTGRSIATCAPFINSGSVKNTHTYIYIHTYMVRDKLSLHYPFFFQWMVVWQLCEQS
jgi:hypothetical protein